MIRDPNSTNDWLARGPLTPSNKPRKISNPLPDRPRLAGLSGVNERLPTEKMIAKKDTVKPLAESVKKAALSFNGGQSITAFNTKSTRYGLGKILKRTITGAANADKLANNILGKAGSNGKIYRKDVIGTLKKSGYTSHQIGSIMNHLGM